MTWVVVAVFLPVALIFGMVLGLVLFLTSTAAACNPSSGISGPAVSVDPKNVPKGPVGGYSGEQLVNAATIMLAIRDLGMSARDQRIAVMTAMGESSLLVLDYGDSAGPDSRGLFQQRDNGAWGTYQQRMDPYQSTVSFGKALKGISDRDTMEPTLVAHAVQRNQNPYHYEPYWEPAGQVVDALVGIPASRSGGAATVAPVGNQNRTRTYELGVGIQPATQVLADTLGPLFDVDTIYGTCPSCRLDHAESVGLALDFMVYEDSAKGQAIADYLTENAEIIGVKYVQWEQHHWDSRNSNGWTLMEDRGSITDNHRDHVHLSLLDTAQPINGAPAAANCASTGAIGPGGWTKPVGGAIDGEDYGMRFHPILHTWKKHYGIDVGNGCDDDIFAINSGTVIQAGPSGGYGNLIEIDHGDGVHSRYAHMYDSGVLVRAGDTVQSGQHIGEVGSAGLSSGCHLHFEIYVDGVDVNPYDFLAARLNL